MIVIFVIFLATVFATQEQYTGLLPDNENLEFSDNVARRNKQSVESLGKELTDGELNKHNSFVQSVMDQNTAEDETPRNKRQVKSSEANDKSKEKERSKEDLQVNPLQFRKNDVDKFDLPVDNMDLKETSITPQSSDEMAKENYASSSTTDNVIEEKLPLAMKSVTSDVTSVETTEPSIIKKSNEEEEKISYQTESILNSVPQITDTDQTVSTTETENENTTNTSSTAFENYSQYETTNETNLLLSVTVKKSSQEVENVVTESATVSDIKLLEADSSKNTDNINSNTEKKYENSSNHFEPSANTTESYMQGSSDGTPTSSITDESSTYSDPDTKSNKKIDLPTTFNSQVFTPKTQNTAEVNTATTENYRAVIENRSEKERLQTITETTTVSPKLTTTNIWEKHSTTTTKIIKFKNGLVSYIASKALNQINHELQLKKQGKFNDSKIETTNKGNTNLNHYRVYEIHWPTKRNNQPFLRSEEPIKDQPYYVPVYKYSPSFAYYNPKNRLGPNEMEQNSIELDTRLREGDNNLNDKVQSSEFILQLNNDLRKFARLKHKRARTRTGKNHFIKENGLRNEEEKEEKDKTKEEKAEDKTKEEKPEDKPKEEKAEEKSKEEKAEDKSKEEKAEDNKTKEVKPEDNKTKEEKVVEEDKSKEKEETTVLQLQECINSEDCFTTLPPTTHANEIKDSCEDKDAPGCGGHSKEARVEHKKKRGATIVDILQATDEKDLLVNLEKLQSMGIPLMRTKAESKVYIYMNVLKDLILENSKSLKQYDWLTTTVQIQTGLTKILKLIKRMKESKHLYPADLQLLRYLVFLHDFSLETKEDNKHSNKLRKRVLQPKKKSKKKSLKDERVFHRVWVLRAPNMVKSSGLNHLYKFLIDVQEGLFDLHEAIRHIAGVTKFDRQNWYGNLKQLYLSTDEKQLLELLLHMSMSRLVDLVEHSFKHTLDTVKFVKFIKTNKKDAKRIVEEMKFINEVVNEIEINK